MTPYTYTMLGFKQGDPRAVDEADMRRALEAMRLVREIAVDAHAGSVGMLHIVKAKRLVGE